LIGKKVEGYQQYLIFFFDLCDSEDAGQHLNSGRLKWPKKKKWKLVEELIFLSVKNMAMDMLFFQLHLTFSLFLV
jgi:hypothetical protein